MRRLFLAFLLVSSLDVTLAAQKRSCAQVLNSFELIDKKIQSLQQLKGTFEGLFPIEPGSIAARFPEAYEQIFWLFNETPSHMMGINNGKPPEPGMRLGDIFANINVFAWNIGELLDSIAKASIPADDPAQAIIQSYVKRFRRQSKHLEENEMPFDPTSDGQLSAFTTHGKNLICSVWAELRLSLRIGHLSRVNVKVRELVKDGVISNADGSLDDYLGREIDHFWFPQFHNTDNRPDAIAIGETKVFDAVFDSQHGKRSKVYEQFGYHLEIASRIGASLGLPPRIYYFFVAGISRGEIARFKRLTKEFNESIQDANPSLRAPVEVIVYGDYSSGRAPASAR